MTVGNKTNFLTINFSKNSLHECLADGVFRGITVRWRNWRRLVGHSNIQPYCQREGFNVRGDYVSNPKPYAKVKPTVYIEL